MADPKKPADDADPKKAERPTNASDEETTDGPMMRVVRRVNEFDVGPFFGGAWTALKTQRKLQIWTAVVVIVLITIGGILLWMGKLDDVYRATYEWYPGRQWTFEMRDNWVWYLVPASLLIGLVLIIFKPDRRKVAIPLAFVFLFGFLGGHVFWGDAGPGHTHCFNSAFEVRLHPHDRLEVARHVTTGDHAVAFQVSVHPRENQERSAFTVDVSELIADLESAAGPGGLVVDQLWVEDDPYVRAVIIRTADGSAFAAGDYAGDVTVRDSVEDASCDLRSDYQISIEA